MAEVGEASETKRTRRGRRELGKRVQVAERAYCHNKNPKIQRIIEQMEEDAMQAQSGSEMEDWEHLLLDPGNTRGRMTLYKRSLHVYWVMKRLLAKSM